MREDTLTKLYFKRDREIRGVFGERERLQKDERLQRKKKEIKREVCDGGGGDGVQSTRG